MKQASLAVAIAALAALPAVARADGLPVLGIDGGDGVVSSAAASRYVTFSSGRDTVVARLHMKDATVARSRSIHGLFTVPVVAYDGSASGLSADQRTLVLIRPRTRFPQARTHLAILDARRLTVSRYLTLRGDFSFDAVSPDGSSIYLVNYLSRNPTDYAVRALDIRSGRLLPHPVVDPHEPDEKMRGMPVTRATSADGRWAYTLYGPTKPFIHALDTHSGTARCIDVEAASGSRDIFSLRLRLRDGGRTLVVVNGKHPLALVDTSTFQVSAPPAPAAATARAAAHAPAHDGGRPWIESAAIALLLVVGGGSVLARRAGPLARRARAR
jgi:hypothetical protein